MRIQAALLLLLLPGPPAFGERAPQADFPLPDAAVLLERVKIGVDPARPRTFLYTNKRAAFYAGRTSGPNDNPNQGLNVFGRKVLEDFALSVDGARLVPASATAVDVYPHALVRRYAGGIEEEVVLLDRVDALVVTLRAPSPVRAAFTPLVAGGSRAGDFDVVPVIPSGFLVTPHVGGDIEQKSPRTVAVRAAVPAREVFVRPPAATTSSGFAPGTVEAGPQREFRFVVAVGASDRDALDLSNELVRDAKALVEARRMRIASLLLDSYVETKDERFDRALAWNKASGDALVTEQAGVGIWAGLYWFNNYWGRDTFISLPGIRLVTGQFEDARRILESFAKFQKTDEKDPLYGRVPNRVNSPTDIIYNTADGTPWFVREAYEYIAYSGDTEFARHIYPAVRRTTDGTLRYRVDANGLLIHEDADSWMDAKWEGRTPWSPRGDRAVDIQALWHAQLEASARLARLAGDVESAARWEREAVRVKESIRRLFRDPESGVLYDHLNSDGTPDRQIRPNQIFALTVPLTPLLAQSEGAPVVRQVVNELTYRYGVASLSQRDPNFHPYHHDERWHFDSAYHNGTVWVWNAGPVITSLVRYGREDLAFEMTRAMVDQTLDLGAVGTLSELIEAIPRDGKLTLSGTETQAWSVAEFVRNVYQDYLGVTPDATSGTLELAPAIPAGLGPVRAVIPFRGDRIKVTYENAPGGYRRCRLYAAKLSGPVKVRMKWGPTRDLVAGRELVLDATSVPKEPSTLGGLAFATPQIVPGLKQLEKTVGPIARATAAEAAVAEPSDARVLYEAADPEGDDRGPNGRYTYPTDSHYEPGILDLTGVRVAEDAERYYFTLRFRHLADPGWHPELGFQLTYAAIAVDRDGVVGSGTVSVGKSAEYSIPSEFAYERIIYVGGAIEVADELGRPLMTYSPATSEGRIGSARERVIRFSIPRRVLGEATPAWRFSVLVGGQDDGGSAGLGVFRAVRREAGQWAGGGAEAEDGAPRVYDTAFPGR